MTWVINNRKPLLYGLLAVLIAIAGYFAWQHFHPPNPVTYESQQQAETAAGVDQAAQAAHISMLQSQLQEAADQIAALKNKPPDVIYHTTVQQVPAQVAANVSNAGADFAIATDPAHPGQAVNLGALKQDTPVTLNEYNVYAYPKIVRGVNVYANRSLSGVGEVSADVSRRITKSGKYLGAAAAYDLDNKQAKFGFRYAF